MSVRCAVRGAWKAWRSEPNFLTYIILILLTVPLNIWLRISVVEVLILFVCACGAFSAECANTAIEYLCDHITQEYNERIGVVKDIVSAAVLWWGIAYFGVEFILIGVKLFA